MAKLRKKGLLVSENGKVQTSWFCVLNKFLHPRALAKPIGRFIPALVELASIVLTAVVKNHSCFSRNGCRPFIEVYNGEKRILTTVQEIEKMRWGATLSSLCWELSPQLNFFGIYIFPPFMVGGEGFSPCLWDKFGQLCAEWKKMASSVILSQIVMMFPGTHRNTHSRTTESQFEKIMSPRVFCNLTDNLKTDSKTLYYSLLN